MEKPACKEAWKMTLKEFKEKHSVEDLKHCDKWKVFFPDRYGNLTYMAFPKKSGRDPVEHTLSYDYHKDFVKFALRKEEDVPTEVLAEYPDLSKT